MNRLVVYGSSYPCPDMLRFRRWREDYEIDLEEIDIARDREAREALVDLVGHASVPTLVASAGDGRTPAAPPVPLRPGVRTRGADRGTVLSEPHPDQIAPFLQRNGIAFRRRAETAPPRVSVTVYPITGRQLFFRVPHSWCVECNLTIRAARTAIGDREDVELRVKPWWNHLFHVLRRGWWHAPVVAVNGRLFSQGVVPDVEALRQAIEQEAGA